MNKLSKRLIVICFASIAIQSGVNAQPVHEGGMLRVPADVLEDKIRGGMLAQVLGNLNGLPHEFKYIAEPGSVETYTPSLPDGARTDDDTDIEWVIASEIERSGEPLLDPATIAKLWKTHINRSIWCANRYSRDLMELGFEPPITGSPVINPWSEFNISGQFSCETFGLMSPGMPRTAAEIGLRYTHVTIDGEPAQTTQLFTAMIATAFVTDDLQQVLAAGMASVDPESNVAAIVAQVREFHAQYPDDWRATREAIKQEWQAHGGSFRDQNGYELNTAATIAALLYADGDLTETMRLAFNFGWDCDNNAATSGTIIGVMKGRRWMNDQGWEIKDIYKNTTRDKMPDDETLTGLEDTVIECARIVVEKQGGKVVEEDGKRFYLINVQQPVNVESIEQVHKRKAKDRERLTNQIAKDLTGDSDAQARAAYLAICLDEADTLKSKNPDQWSSAITALQQHKGVVRNIFEVRSESSQPLKDTAKRAGLRPPTP